jgi:sulfatase modifying factor 1
MTPIWWGFGNGRTEKVTKNRSPRPAERGFILLIIWIYFSHSDWVKSPLLLPCAIFLSTLVLLQAVHAQPLVNIETVAVANVGNAADTNGHGAVSYDYRIGKYEVSISQYAAFLNSAASVTSDTYIVNLWNGSMATDLNVAGISRSGNGTLASPYSYSVIGSGNRPISWISWFDAARFANWVNNGATNGASTETGAYTLNGATNGVITKNVGATWWLPSESEWYKAAYYKGGSTNAGYWSFATQSDSQPNNSVGAGTNRANYFAGDFAVTQSASYTNTQNYLTEVGAFVDSTSAYGTFDQSGNVNEWNDAVINGSNRGVRGGNWIDQQAILRSSYRIDIAPTDENAGLGLRLATVPEPSTYALLLMAGVGAVWMLRRRHTSE